MFRFWLLRVVRSLTCSRVINWDVRYSGAFRSQERALSSIMTLVQAKVIYTPPLFYAAKGLWCIKLKFHCNSKSVWKGKRLDFLTDLKLSNMCVQTLTKKDHKGPQTNMPKNVGTIKT